MEFETPVLEWLFNVVLITAFACLAVLCYLLKEDNKKLTIELAQRTAEPIAASDGAPSAGRISSETIGRKASQLEHQDIRQFVALRSRYWL